MSCSQCGAKSVHVKCVHCDRRFCDAICAKADGQQPIYIRYRDTNYIFGTKHNFTLWHESHHVTDASNNRLFTVGDLSIMHIFGLVELSKFHRRTPADAPQCCDRPYRVIEYGPDWVADMNEVPELADAMLDMYETNQQQRSPVLHKSMMRVQSSMKKNI